MRNYDKKPYTPISGELIKGWGNITSEIDGLLQGNYVLAIDTYTAVNDAEVLTALKAQWSKATIIATSSLMKQESEVRKMTQKYVTDDELFGYMSPLDLEDYFDDNKVSEARKQIKAGIGPVIVYGCGAAYVATEPDLLLYLDMARWEIQQRFRTKTAQALGVDNSSESPARQYKRGYFNDWDILDRHKKGLFTKVDFWIDTHLPNVPKMIGRETYFKGIDATACRPFRVVPFFDAAPWGGQWMKEVCELDRSKANYGWCFDCVPEENSLLFKVDGELFELPSTNLVFLRPKEVLGASGVERFGDDFPIRFDFLDTMQGGNLSLQVHPTNDYIQKNFGLKYTQDESYYLIDAEPDSCVYLGVKDGVQGEQMIAELNDAQQNGTVFDADKYINRFPVKKHDHYLIPNGTIHCSGSGGMVLEISTTPSIFTFKMWDWQRLGLDGKPRPINIAHAANVINWERRTDVIKAEHCNVISEVASGDGWKEERTGLHNAEFIETRRHWFTKSVLHSTQDRVNVLNLVEGESAIVESPTNAFEPLEVHYAETFIIPACVGEYTITPVKADHPCGTLKAYVRETK